MVEVSPSAGVANYNDAAVAGINAMSTPDRGWLIAFVLLTAMSMALIVWMVTQLVASDLQTAEYLHDYLTAIDTSRAAEIRACRETLDDVLIKLIQETP